MKDPVNRQISNHPWSHDENTTVVVIYVSEDIAVNVNLLKYVK